MIDINSLIDDLKIEDTAYINYIKKKYNEFILVSDLPVAYLEHNIDEKKLSTKLKILKDNIVDIVKNRYNYVFNVTTYKDTGNLTSLVLDSYFLDIIKTKDSVENIIYIDTNLILDDYKKLMDVQGGDIRISLSHSYETITRNLENAPYVIWDKFSLVNSNYDKQKLYNILLTRSRRCLGNIFFIRDATQVLSTVFDTDMYELMDIAQLVDLSQQNIVYKNKGKTGGAKW